VQPAGTCFGFNCGKRVVLFGAAGQNLLAVEAALADFYRDRIAVKCSVYFRPEPW